MVDDDQDPTGTDEWREALESVLAVEGPQRAHDLLDELIAQARAAGAPVPYSATTPYVNTIAVEDEPQHPGDRAVEHRIRSAIRWNAVATVLRANKESSELGGHIASFQSAATLYDTGFQHFWHAPSAGHGGDLVMMQGHSSPGIYARAFLEGRLTEEQMDSLPPGGGRERALVVPAPVADAGLLAVPDGVDGPRPADGDLPGPVPEVPARPRARRDREPPRLGVPGRRRDGRAGVAGRDLAGRPRAPRQPDLRRQLQPAAPRRAGPRQREDHPGAGGPLPGRGLERHQGHLGEPLGPAARRGHRPGSSTSSWRRRSTASTRPSSPRTAPTSASTSSAATRRPRRWSRTGPTTRSGR